MYALRNFVSILIVYALTTACSSGAVSNDSRDCTGVFFAELTNGIHQRICIQNIMYYQLKSNSLHFKVKNQDVAGNTVFSIKLHNYAGTGSYDLGPESGAHISLNVYGASSEFYDCQNGILNITEANANGLKADFNIVMEGFYNKKTIRVKGDIHL